MTSSGHTGERAIHSDFSAFTKRLHRPSLLRFLTQLLPLRLSICTSATASVELCSPRGEVPWNFAAVCHRARVSSLAKTHTVSVFCVWVFRMHVAVYGTSNCKICDDFRLITLRSRLEDYERESSNFSRRTSSTNAVIEETLASHLSPSLAPSWKSRPSFLPSCVGPLPPLSGSPTSLPVRQVWPFTQWPSFRPTRRMS